MTVGIVHRIVISICCAEVSIFGSQAFSISRAITITNSKGGTTMNIKNWLIQLFRSIKQRISRISV
ncbi:MAG: hypothetical protein OEZ48_12375 [Candidatus Bathyarchaeota archaeon]|nr:hypothetical protein [Candidatus Bathyarchaeota archaeon]